MAATFWFAGVGAMGTRSVAASSLRSAEARARGSWVSSAPSSSASYSRVRDSENWMRAAAMGASSAIAMAPRKPRPPSSPSLREPPPKNMRNWAMDVTIPAMAAATDEVRMSRL